MSSSTIPTHFFYNNILPACTTLDRCRQVLDYLQALENLKSEESILLNRIGISIPSQMCEIRNQLQKVRRFQKEVNYQVSKLKFEGAI